MRNRSGSRARRLAPFLGTLLILSVPLGVSLGCRRLLSRPTVLLLQVSTDETPVPDSPIQPHGNGVVQETIRVLKRRVRDLGASYAVVTAADGTNDQVKVELWDVVDVVSAQRILTTRGRLELKVVEGVESTRESLLQDRGGVVPPDLDVVSGSGDATGSTIFYLVRRENVITGRDVKAARSSVEVQTHNPSVGFRLNAAGAAKFERETARNIGRRVAIILDGRVMSAPTIHSPIKDQGQITGRFTEREAAELAQVLGTGELPSAVTCVSVAGPGRR